MRVGIAMWDGRVSPVFDTARQLLLADIERGQIAHRSEAGLAESSWANRARRLSDLGIQVLICGGISPGLAAMISGSGIRVIPGVAGDVEQVLKAFSSGRIPSQRFVMPGWRCGRAKRFRGRW